MVIAIPSRCFADEAFRQSSGVIEKWVRMRIRVKADDGGHGSGRRPCPALARPGRGGGVAPPTLTLRPPSRRRPPATVGGTPVGQWRGGCRPRRGDATPAPRHAAVPPSAPSLQAAAQQNAEQNRCWATAEQKAICWARLFGNTRRTERHSVRRRCWFVSWVGYSTARNWIK